MAGTIKFTRGVPPVESFPTAQLAACTASALEKYGDQIQQYAGSKGFLPLRQQVAEGHQTDPELVLVGQGSLQLLDIAARNMLEPGDLVLVESPSYDRAVTTLQRARANVVGIPLQSDGPDLAVLRSTLKGGVCPRLFYVIPDFQNPSGCMISVEKRRAILELADQYGFWVVEDSPYRILRYRGSDLPRLFDLKRERVVLMSSFSKTICPGLRVGYMVVPEPLMPKLAKAAEDTYINTSYINQATVYEYIQQGWFETHLTQLKALYLDRLVKMNACLEAEMTGLGDWSKPDGGFFTSLMLKNAIPYDVLMRDAQEAGLELTDGRGFFADRRGENFIRLPFCGLSPQEIEMGVARLGKLLRRR